VAPPITPEALFGDEHDSEVEHGEHGAYNNVTLEICDYRGSMSERDLDDLIAYLRHWI